MLQNFSSSFEQNSHPPLAKQCLFFLGGGGGVDAQLQTESFVLQDVNVSVEQMGPGMHFSGVSPG